MATGLKNSGEELFIKGLFREDLADLPGTLSVLLFDDSTDAIGDSGDLSSVNTEPDGTYARQNVSLGTTSIAPSVNASSNWLIDIADQQFDTSSLTSSQSVADYGIVMTASLSGDSSPTDHLIWTGDLDQSYDLSNIDTFTLQDAGIIFD